MLKRILTSLIALTAVNACVISTPFKHTDDASLAATGEQDRVIVALTHAKLKSGREYKHDFYRYVDAVVDTLEEQPGLVGYSIRRQLFGSDAWTMTVWQDQASLLAFKAGDAHVQAMRFGSEATQSAAFAQVEMDSSAIPLDWQAAERILAQQGRQYKYQ